MDSLTRAELSQYPGDDLTEQAIAHHNEHATPIASDASARCRALPRRIDLRPFPGRDRLERAKCYLRAHFVRAESWSDESLSAMAGELIASSELVE
jgi:hypothetical protein